MSNNIFGLVMIKRLPLLFFLVFSVLVLSSVYSQESDVRVVFFIMDMDGNDLRQVKTSDEVFKVMDSLYFVRPDKYYVLDVEIFAYNVVTDKVIKEKITYLNKKSKIKKLKKNKA